MSETYAIVKKSRILHLEWTPAATNVEGIDSDIQSCLLWSGGSHGHKKVFKKQAHKEWIPREKIQNLNKPFRVEFGWNTLGIA